MYTHTHIRTHSHTHSLTHTHTHRGRWYHPHPPTHDCVRVRPPVCMYVYVYVCMRASVCVCVCVCVYTHTYAHTHSRRATTCQPAHSLMTVCMPDDCVPSHAGLSGVSHGVSSPLIERKGACMFITTGPRGCQRGAKGSEGGLEGPVSVTQTRLSSLLMRLRWPPSGRSGGREFIRNETRNETPRARFCAGVRALPPLPPWGKDHPLKRTQRASFTLKRQGV
jgi:hypothetical protein